MQFPVSVDMSIAEMCIVYNYHNRHFIFGMIFGCSFNVFMDQPKFCEHHTTAFLVKCVYLTAVVIPVWYWAQS